MVPLYQLVVTDSVRRNQSSVINSIFTGTRYRVPGYLRQPFYKF